MNKTILRIQQIVIDIPTNTAEPFIHLYIQKCIRDEENNNIQIIDRYHQVHRKLLEVITQTTHVDDFITRESYNISLLGIYRSIADVTLIWMRETFGGNLSGEELDITEVN